MSAGRSTPQEVRRYLDAVRRDPCAYCSRRPADRHTLDHIVPLNGPDGTKGSNTWKNLTASCLVCNSQKDNQSLLRYLVARTQRRQIHTLDA